MGVNAYGLYQLSPDKTNGVNVGGARETQFYLGPGGGYDATFWRLAFSMSPWYR